MVSLLKKSRWAFAASAIALAAGLASCAPNTSTPSGPNTATGTNTTTGGATVALNGAGASAPNPLYQRWFADYGKTNPSVQVSYQSVGSGAGVKQFLEQTVDFAATDDPLKDEDRAKFPKDRGTPIQVPTTGLFIVLAYNLDGVENLKLSRQAYCGIADGSIKTWNDPIIAKENTDAKLPDTPITFVHRSDGSGTTAIFTKHLEEACPNWKAGSGKTIEWPTGTGAKGNEGVTAGVQQTPGAVGYMEYSYAKENNLKAAALQNKAGDFVEPTPENASKALEGVKPDANLVVKAPDPDQKGAYPIVSLTYLLLYSQYPDAQKGETLKNLVNWAMREGDSGAEELGYIPLPDEITSQVASKLDTIKVAAK